jgi:hypothetical protein
MRDRKILKSLKYLVLTAAILIGATGVSNANPFTVTADVGCDPAQGMGATEAATIDSVTATTGGVAVVGSTINLGTFEKDETATISFAIDADGATDCAGNEADATVTINFTDDDAMQALTSSVPSIQTSNLASGFTVTFTAPAVSENLSFSETISFSITSP